MTPAPDDILIETACEADLPAVLQLNESAVPHVNHLDMPDLQRLAWQSMAFTVARHGAAVAGFLLVLPEGRDYASLNYAYFAEHYPRFAYVDRIVVGADYRGSGVGSRLYGRLLAQDLGDKPLVACEVNLRPPNPASVSFHQRLGFKGVGEQATEQGTKRVLLMVRESGTPP